MALTQKQLNMFNSSPALKELKDWFIAMDNINNPAPIKKYYFISYADAEGNTEWGEGMVKTTGVIEGNYTQVQVKKNAPNEDFIGQKFYITSNAKTDGTLYQLYSDAGNTGTGIYVSVSTTPIKEE